MRSFQFFNMFLGVYLFFLADETGPAEESKRTKRVQGWFRQVLNFGFLDCICNFCDSFVKFYD